MELYDIALNGDCVRTNRCRCSDCGWEGNPSACETEIDGDYYGYYTINLCPVCEDGGCIDDYWYVPSAVDDLLCKVEGQQ